MSTFGKYPLRLKLSLVPAIAALSFAAYLVYSSMALSGGNALLMEIRDVQFPVLYAAGENIKSFEGVVESLNSAAATGDPDFLSAAEAKATEIRDRYQAMERIDPRHHDEIGKLKTGFNSFYALAFDVAKTMSSGPNVPSLLQIKELRELRDAYSQAEISYRDRAEQDFKETIKKAIDRSESAQRLGELLGPFMLLVIAVLTLLVNRGIVALEMEVERRNRELVSVNLELEQEIQKLKEAEEARSHAEAASMIKDAFLANMSHELRTPMNAVIGLSYLCLQTDLSGKQRDYLEKINGAAKSLLGILNDILDVSKIEAGKMEMDRIPFQLEDVMANLATIVGVRSQEKNLAFRLETAPNVPPSLVGDPLRLGQVLINLAGNAVKFTEKGEVHVRVDVQKETDDQVTLRFTVKDTGIGMTQKEIDNLFRPFTQADTSITRKFGGTGLGLTISKRLVQMMGGEISVKSLPGAGSQFAFSAIFQKAGKSAWDAMSTGTFRIAGAQFNRVLVSQFRGARMLLVEDDEINRQVAQEMLEGYGIIVTLAENGAEAIARLNEGQFDGVLMDMQMPVMDGVTATREIRKNPRFSELPIIALTANVMVSEQNKILAAGMNDRIGKPIDPDRLVATLARWVRPSLPAKASTGAAAPATAPASEPLPDLPGVQVEASVRRIGGNVGFYYSLLDKFRESQRDVVPRMREALSRNDPGTAERVAHTLKGIAGTLGAETLQDQAARLESDIRDGAVGRVEPLLEQIDLELAGLISKIDRAIEARGK